MPMAPGLGGGGSYGPGAPVAAYSQTSTPRRLVTRVAGSWPCQLISLVAREPNMASGSVPLSPTAVASMMAVAPAAVTGFQSMSGAPENDPTDTNVSGWRAAYVVDPKPPCESPATARPSRAAIVRRLASTHGMSWATWNVSHCEGPS